MTARTQDAVVFGPKAKHAGLRAAVPKKCGARTSPTPGWAEGRLPKLPRTTAAAFMYCAGSSGAAARLDHRLRPDVPHHRHLVAGHAAVRSPRRSSMRSVSSCGPAWTCVATAPLPASERARWRHRSMPVSYTHLRAHETVLD